MSLEDTNRRRPAERFEYQKSLKERDQYPFLKYFPAEKYFTRPLASLVVRAVYRTSITPNQLTVTSFLLALASSAVFLGGRHAHFILGGTLFQLSSIVDCADGMLARSKDLCTRYGALLDLFCDRVADFLVLLGMAFGLFRQTGNRSLLIVCLVCIGLLYLQVSLYYLMRHYLGKENIGHAAEGRGLMVFLIFICSLLNRIEFFLVIVAVELAINLVSKAVSVIRWGIRDGRSA